MISHMISHILGILGLSIFGILKKKNRHFFLHTWQSSKDCLKFDVRTYFYRTFSGFMRLCSFLFGVIMPVADPKARHIVINGLPQNVTAQKRELFQRHLEKKISELLGHSQFTIHLLTNPQSTLVYGAFLSCTTESQAEAALAKLNMYRLTKSDVFTTYRFSAFDNLKQPEEEYVPPTIADDSVDEDLVHNMAEDENARPQFLTKGGVSMDCEWYWFDWEKNEPVLYRRPNVIKKDDPLKLWSELDRKERSLRPGIISSLQTRVRPLPTWSTYGTMIISQHTSGLRVWGGRSMHMLYEIPGEDINAFMVSPSEKYIVVKTTNDLTVLNFRTAKRIRTLGNLDLHSLDLWPITRFSADDSLCAVCKINFDPDDHRKLLPGKLYIYESETMHVLHSQSQPSAGYTFSIDGLYKAEWNPALGTQMAYVTSQGAQHGWKVVISNIVVDEDKIVSEEILVQRHFLQAESVDMLWHPGGTNLAVKVQLKNTIEYFLFQMDRKNIPVSRLEIQAGYIPERFAWQATGEYVAVLLSSTVTKTLGETGVLQVYSFRNNKLKLLNSISTPATSIFWAPKESRLVAATFEKSVFQFISVYDDGSVVERNKVTNVPSSDLQWDPTGRFCAIWLSCAPDPHSDMVPRSDGQYRIFDAHGKQLFQKELTKFSHFAWRPLPPTLLTTEEIKGVKSKLKEIVKDYEKEKAETAERERDQVTRHNQELEEMYIRKMNDLARKARDQRLAEKREALQNQSIWKRYWDRRLKALPQEDSIVKEEVTEERIVSTRILGPAK
eukprot:gene11113-7739_t